MPIDVYIGGVLIDGSGDYRIAEAPTSVDAMVRSRKTASVSVRSVANFASPPAGTEVKIYSHGGGLRFGGYVDRVDRTLDHAGQRNHALSCRDYSSIADLRSAGERVYLNVKLNDIIRDLVTDSLATDGVTLGLVAAGGGPTIERLELDYPTVAEAFNAACKAAGGFEWEITGDKEMRLYQPSIGASVATWNNTTIGIIDETVKGKADLSGYANKVVVVLSRVITPEQTESFGGAHATQPTNGTRRDWEVDFPVNAVPTITVNAAAQTVGLDGVDTGKDWYWQASSAVIRQDPLATALINTDTLEIVYFGEQAQQVFAQDAAEIAVRAAIETRSGVYEKIIRSSAAVAQADAQQVADSILAQLKQEPYEIEVEVDGAAPLPGEKYTLGFDGHPTGDYLVSRTQWAPILGSWDAATGSPLERTRVFLSKGTAIRDIYESWKEAFGTAGGSASVTGGSSGGLGGAVISPWYPITYGATITPNIANGTNQRCTLTGDITVNFPTGAVDGGGLTLVLIQDATGSRVVTLATGWKLDGGEVVPLLSTKTTIKVVFKSASEVEAVEGFTTGIPV